MTTRIVAALLVSLLAVSADAAKYKARWVLIHEPSQAAEQNARDFAARVAKETGGELEVEVVTKSGYEKEKYGTRKNLSHYQVIKDLSSGGVEFTQIYTASLSMLNRELILLNQPYVFRDYDHAEAVFEGPVGERLLALVPPSSGVRTLATTYSGGFGIFGTKGRAVRRPEDMKGLKLSTERFPWVGPYINALGIEPLVAPPEAFVLLAQNGFADAVETVPSRFWEYGDERGADHVTMTNHFLLTTMIAVNEKFYQSLPEKHRRVVERVALDTGREERRLAIRLNEEAREKLEEKGVKFVDLTKEEHAAFRQALLPAWDARALKWDSDLISTIQKVGAKSDTARR